MRAIIVVYRHCAEKRDLGRGLTNNVYYIYTYIIYIIYNNIGDTNNMCWMKELAPHRLYTEGPWYLCCQSKHRMDLN